MQKKPKSILVLGHSGFVGKRLLKKLRTTYPHARLTGASLEATPLPGATVHACDMCDTPALTAILKHSRPDWIFHAAGVPGGDDPASLFQSHIASTLSLFKAAETLKKKNPRILMLSSAAEYGILRPSQLPIREDAPSHPATTYGMAKATQTELAKLFASRGKNIVIARAFNILGAGLSPSLALSSFIDQVVSAEEGKASPILEVGNLSAKRDFVDITDLIDALIRIAERGKCGEIYNICSGRSISMRALVKQLLGLSHRKIRLRPVASRMRPVDIPDMRGSIKKTARVTGWKARIRPEDSLKNMLEHRRAHPPVRMRRRG